MTKAQVEAAARALWKMGNARIGHRPWEAVCAHYIAEATVALEAAAVMPAADEGPGWYRNYSTLARWEEVLIVETLAGNGGKISETARDLGISRTTLWRRLKTYGVVGADYR